MLSKLVLTVLELNWYKGFRDKNDTLWSSNHVFHTTVKQVILRQRKNENECEMCKTEKQKKKQQQQQTGARRSKLLFPIQLNMQICDVLVDDRTRIFSRALGKLQVNAKNSD